MCAPSGKSQDDISACHKARYEYGWELSASALSVLQVYTQKHKIHMQCQSLQTVVSSAQEQSGFAELKALQKSSTNCAEVRVGTVPHAYFTQFRMTGSLQK